MCSTATRPTAQPAPTGRLEGFSPKTGQKLPGVRPPHKEAWERNGRGVVVCSTKRFHGAAVAVGEAGGGAHSCTAGPMRARTLPLGSCRASEADPGMSPQWAVHSVQTAGGGPQRHAQRHSCTHCKHTMCTGWQWLPLFVHMSVCLQVCASLVCVCMWVWVGGWVCSSLSACAGGWVCVCVLGGGDGVGPTHTCRLPVQVAGAPAAPPGRPGAAQPAPGAAPASPPTPACRAPPPLPPPPPRRRSAAARRGTAGGRGAGRPRRGAAAPGGGTGGGPGRGRTTRRGMGPVGWRRGDPLRQPCFPAASNRAVCWLLRMHQAALPHPEGHPEGEGGSPVCPQCHGKSDGGCTRWQ